MFLKQDLLIQHAAVIMTGAAGTAARANGTDIRIKAGKIAAIGTLVPEAGEQTFDATDCVIYPAWVNTHHHLFQSVLKGDPAGINLPLTAWLGSTPYRMRPHFDEALLRTAVRIGLVEMLLSGCGTVADHHYLYGPHLPFDSSRILFEEAERLGVRFVLCRGGATQVRQLEAELPKALAPETLDSYLRDIERLAKDWHDPAPDSFRRVVAAPTTPLHSMSGSELQEVADTARKLGLRLHSHLSETVSYSETAQAKFGCLPIEYVDKHGWLGSDVWFAHLVKLEPEEIKRLGETGTGIAHCPQSNGRLGSGIAPLVSLEAAGAPISIGVDGAASNEAADMISEVHTTWLMQRAKQGEACRPSPLGGEPSVLDVTVEDVIRWGSAGGAKVLGLDQVGQLAVGMAADLAIWRLDDPQFWGLHDVGIGPVVSGGRPKLARLFIGGRCVVKDDHVLGLDQLALGAEARAAVKRLKAS